MLYRHHNVHVVFLGFLSDGATLVTVDETGEVATWPAAHQDVSGFGWFLPRKRFQTLRGMRAIQATGPTSPIWPAVGGRGAAGRIAQGGAGEESAWSRT